MKCKRIVVAEAKHKPGFAPKWRRLKTETKMQIESLQRQVDLLQKQIECLSGMITDMQWHSPNFSQRETDTALPNLPYNNLIRNKAEEP